MGLPRVYFFCRNDSNELQEDVVALAEGLVELEIPFFANCDYWLQSTDPRDYLIKYTPEVTSDDCDIVVVSYTWPLWFNRSTHEVIPRPLPQELFRKGRRFNTVYIDSWDSYRTVSWDQQYRSFDLILRTKL